MDSTETKSDDSVRFWRRATRVLQALLAVSVAMAVWMVGFSPGSEPAPLLPDTETQFSLDLTVSGTADHDVIYAVEQRARPHYRIFSMDPRSGEIETILTVPEDAIIYGIALDDQKETLAVAYSPDFTLNGSGIWILDLADGAFTEVAPVVSDVYLTDAVWSSDGESILATKVDRREDVEYLSITKISIDGHVEEIIADAINPVPIGDTIYYLSVDDSQARRSIGVIEPSGAVGSIQINDGQSDLDHLLAGEDDQSLRVAVLDTTDGGLTIGEEADAHGNHNVSSTWWDVAVDNSTEPTPSEIEPIVVYDAASSGSAIVYATGEGLAIAMDSRIDIIKSRAIRFVAS